MGFLRNDAKQLTRSKELQRLKETADPEMRSLDWNATIERWFHIFFWGGMLTIIK